MLLIFEYLFTFPVRHPRTTFVVFLLFEIVLNAAIILRIPYTEIDWKAYMQQVSQFLAGERDYTKIYGSTGPLVYPAGFVYIFSILYSFTSKGTDIFAAQAFFAVLYILNWMVLYLIYSKTRIPFFYLPLLMLSRRVHSIYSLRLFNDPLAMFFVYLAILALVSRRYWIATTLISLGLSVKMNVLLFFPGWALILLVQNGLVSMVLHLFFVAAIQILLALPFLSSSLQYWSCAFDLRRAFLYEWTVNWKFLSPELFSDPLFSWFLLFVHLVLLSLFLLAFWSRVSGGLRLFIIRSCMYPMDPHPNMYSTEDQLTILFTCNLIGIICARSLHYQFYVWYFHSLPFLMYKSSLSLPLQYTIFFIIEICWNIFPPTAITSSFLLLSHLTLLYGLFRYHYYALRFRE